MGTTATRQDLENTLIQRCWKDPEFRKQVVSDPKGMLERQLGTKLPGKLTITIHEEDTNTLHLTIPLSPTNVAELSDEDLEKVAGGSEVVLAFVFGVVTAGVTLGAGTAAATVAVATGKSPW